MNESRTCADRDTQLTRGRSGPVRYELIDKDGRKVPGVFTSMTYVREYVAIHWPGQEQDPERSGCGWDIQIEGAK